MEKGQTIYVDDINTARATQWAEGKTYDADGSNTLSGTVPFNFLIEVGVPYIATSNFEPQSEGDLGFVVGELVYIEDIERATAELWGIARKYTGTASGHMELGMVPFNYLVPATEAAKKAAEEAAAGMVVQ